MTAPPLPGRGVPRRASRASNARWSPAVASLAAGSNLSPCRLRIATTGGQPSASTPSLRRRRKCSGPAPEAAARAQMTERSACRLCQRPDAASSRRARSAALSIGAERLRSVACDCAVKLRGLYIMASGWARSGHRACSCSSPALRTPCLQRCGGPSRSAEFSLIGGRTFRTLRTLPTALSHC
jgi:hypothetical protein